jgi:hypothetical protein
MVILIVEMGAMNTLVNVVMISSDVKMGNALMIPYGVIETMTVGTEQMNLIATLSNVSQTNSDVEVVNAFQNR